MAGKGCERTILYLTGLTHIRFRASGIAVRYRGRIMNRTRSRALHIALVTSLALLLVAGIAPQLSTAQQEKSAGGARPQPTPPPDGQDGSAVGDGPVIVHTDLVTLTVTVTDQYGRYVSGLQQNAFKVFDDKEEQEITYFSDDDAPVSVGIVFDLSGSMSGDKISRARQALSRFIETSHNSDEYFLIGFNSRAQLLMERTRNGDAVLDKLTFIQTKGQTALYDACYLGVEKVQRGAHPKRAIILISDGQDNNSRYNFGEVRKLLKESDVVLYGIGILGGSDPGSTEGMLGQSILDELASVSGGKAFFPNSAAEMDEIFERIALELRHQYSIGYRPKSFANDGKWHKLKVKVTPPRGLPRLFVRSREGYYAVTNPR
jgi:Ca-activated chloride channel family protein